MDRETAGEHIRNALQLVDATIRSSEPRSKDGVRVRWCLQADVDAITARLHRALADLAEYPQTVPGAFERGIPGWREGI